MAKQTKRFTTTTKVVKFYTEANGTRVLDSQNVTSGITNSRALKKKLPDMVITFVTEKVTIERTVKTISLNKRKAMNKVQEKRLLKIIARLRHGELAHEKFDFNVINYPVGLDFYKEVKNKKVKNCGTSGCAIGEFPLLFKDFSYNDAGRLIFKTRGGEFFIH